MAINKLLVVDDEPAFGQMIEQYFKPHGYEVFFTTQLEEAISLFRRHRPRVALLDFNMPLITGEKFMPVLQSMDPLVRVIVVTGHLGEDVEEKFKGLGYYAYFEKGNLSLEMLKAKVDEALQSLK